MLTKNVHDLNLYVGRAQKLMADYSDHCLGCMCLVIMSLITCIQCIHFVVVVDLVADSAKLIVLGRVCSCCAPLCALARCQVLVCLLQSGASKLVTPVHISALCFATIYYIVVLQSNFWSIEGFTMQIAGR